MSKKTKSSKYVKKIIHWTDPDYLDAFYSDWGAGQSVTTYKQHKGQKADRTGSKDPEALRKFEEVSRS